jgi:hypothetical protein
MSLRQCTLARSCEKPGNVRSGFLRRAVVIAAVTTIFVALTGSWGAAQQKPNAKLDGMAQAQISASIGKDQSTYHFVAKGNSFSAANARNSLSAEFNSDGVSFRSGNNHLDVALRGYGYGDNLVAAEPVAPRAKANRLEYSREGITEWYVNGPVGLEQGFTLATRPRGDDSKPLSLLFTLSGDLTASVEPGARAVGLKKNGFEVLRYADLAAVDSTGREFPASFDLVGKNLSLRIDDKGAEYPLTVDPMVQSVELTSNVSGCILNALSKSVTANTSCSSGEANDQFGYSVAVSSDGGTVVVGAPHANGTNEGSGAAYVFLRPSRGWGSCITTGCNNYVAKLTPGTPGQVVQEGYAVSVGISGDGNTIVVMANTFPKTDSGAGILYVYVKPSTGWATTGQQAAILSLYGPTETPCNQTDADPNDCFTIFPSSMSINGDGSVIAFGYAGALINNLSDGAVYIYVRPSTGWADSYLPVKLTASDATHLALLGESVSISSDGTVIAAGADQANGDAGAVYVFVQPSGGWINGTQTAELTYAPGDGFSFLGFNVSISGDGHTVVASGNGRGFLYFATARRFCFNGTCSTFYIWSNRSESAQLTASDAAPLGHFVVSGDGSTIAAQNLLSSPGSVYLFAKGSGGWTSSNETQKISASDGAAGDNFGGSIALDNIGTLMLAGAPGATVGSNTSQGTAYILGGYAGTPTASVSPTSLAFGNQIEGTTSSSQSVTVTNTGNAPLDISGVAVSAQYTSTQNCVSASPLAPGASCSENVAFAPTSQGAISGTLTFTDNSGGSTTQQVQLSGAGIVTATATTISSSVNPSTYGQSVTFTAVVTNASRTPTGSVTFTDGATAYGPVALTGGTASIAISTLSVGSHSIVANYTGDAVNSFAPSSSAPVTQTVNLATSTTTVSSSVNPSYINQTVTFTATMASQFGGALSGNVTFKQGATTLATVSLPLGSTQVTYSTTYTTAGTYSITAVYSGDTNSIGSTSAALRQTVKALPIATKTVVTTSGSPSFINQSVTFTASISSTDGVPDNATVTFFDGATAIGTTTSTSGLATFSTSALAARTHTIKATYAGDTTYATSTGSVSQVVSLYPTTTAVTATPNAISFGQTVQLTATVTSTAPGGPTGTVRFAAGTTALGSAPLSGTTATLSTAKIPAGTTVITATYVSDGVSATSSGTAPISVAQATTTTSLVSSLNPANAGQSVKFTATVSSPTAIPTGSVTFMDGTTTLATATLSGGKASYTTTALTSGTHNITVVYGGTTNIVGSTSAVLVETVN